MTGAAEANMFSRAALRSGLAALTSTARGAREHGQPLTKESIKYQIYFRT